MQKTSKIILGIDPGTVIMGYGLIKLTGNQMELIEMGTLKFSAKLEPYERLKKIQQKITEIIQMQKPVCMAKDGNASLFYRDAGDIFDQIMVSQQLTLPDYSSFRYWKAGIFNKSYLIQTTGQYKGYPLRNSLSEPGFSDHFPVYIYLIKQLH